MAMMMPLTQRYTKKRVRMRMRITLKRKIMPKMKIMIMPRRVSSGTRSSPDE
jgi:hypothetical protein